MWRGRRVEKTKGREWQDMESHYKIQRKSSHDRPVTVSLDRWGHVNVIGQLKGPAFSQLSKGEPECRLLRCQVGLLRNWTCGSLDSKPSHQGCEVWQSGYIQVRRSTRASLTS